MTTRLLQWHALQQLECMWWFLLHDVFPGEPQPGWGCSIWRVSLTRPTQPLRAGGITCLSATDHGRWRDHYAGVEGKSKAVMKEYINMYENTLNTSNLGLDFSIWKHMEVFSCIGIGTGSFALRGRASSLSDVVACLDLRWITVHLFSSLSTEPLEFWVGSFWDSFTKTLYRNICVSI